MILRVFASGSGGNCLLISSADTNIIIDAGISMRRIQRALEAHEIKMEEIGGVLITHEHSDHISGLKMLTKHYSLPIFTPHTVAARLAGRLPECEEFIHIIPVNEDFYIGSLKIRAFHTPHDTDESVGYRLSDGCSDFAVATDMGHVTEEIRQGLSGCDTVLIESNHDETMLTQGPYPAALKRRILSDRGHLSNNACALLARELAEEGTERIILGHLSPENNTPELARSVTASALEGLNTDLYVAPALGLLEIRTGRRVRA